MTLRQQLMLKRTLRNFRTWAPPISIGVIIGVLFFFAAEHLDRANAQPQQSAAISYASPPAPQRQPGVLQAAQVDRQPHAIESYEPAAFRNLQAAQVDRQRHPIESHEPAAFRNCAAARAAGADPVYADEPGFGAHLDRDGDGIGCEPYRN